MPDTGRSSDADTVLGSATRTHGVRPAARANEVRRSVLLVAAPVVLVLVAAYPIVYR